MSPVAPLLIVLFLVVPILEVWLIVQVGQTIGGWPTFTLLVVESLLGGWLVRREGRRAWRGLQTSLQGGRLPGRELADAALLLVGGTLLLTPGFLTDVLGFLLVLPFTRPVLRRVLLRLLARRLRRRPTSAFPGVFPAGPAGPNWGGPDPWPGRPSAGRENGRQGTGPAPRWGPVVPGEVDREDRD